MPWIMDSVDARMVHEMKSGKLAVDSEDVVERGDRSMPMLVDRMDRRYYEECKKIRIECGRRW